MGSKKIFLKEKGFISCIEINDIIHIQCESYLSTVYTSDNKKITLSKPLKQFEEELKGEDFLRINHSTIINIKHIDKIIRGEKRKIILANQVEIKISRRKMYLIKELIEK